MTHWDKYGIGHRDEEAEATWWFNVRLMLAVLVLLLLGAALGGCGR